MFCKNCGKELEDGALFCTGCGKRIGSAAPGTQTPQPEPVRPGKNNKSGIKIAVALVAALAVIIVGAYFGMKQYKFSKYDSELTSYEQEKEKYDLAAEYSDYENLLEECRKAVDDKDSDSADSLMEEVKTSLESLKEANESYVEDKLAAYALADWSTADPDDKSTYDTESAKIEDLRNSGEYSQLKTIFEELDEVCIPYIESENALDVNIQQIDVSAYPEISLYMNVTDTVTGEVPDDLDTGFFFIRKEDANGDYVRQTITQVNQLNELEALSVDMVADVSGTMNGTPLEQAKNAMSQFINSVQFNAGDEVELTSFSTGVQIEMEFSSDASALVNEVNSFETDNMTSLYDALYTAVTRVASQQGARCVIAFTDGLDNYSSNTVDSVIDTAERYHVPVFIVGFGEADYSTMSYIAEQTGGRYYYIDDVSGMQEIYQDIYRMEKEMYLVKFTDESGGSMTDEVDLLAGYHSAVYGGESTCSFQPNLLNSVEGDNLYTSGPEAVVESYLKGFDDAMTNEDFSYIEDYLENGSSIYESQKKYVTRGITEMLDSYEISDVDYESKKVCVITTRETYYVQKPGEALELMTQQCQYRVKKTSDGWKMTDFVGTVNVLSRINT